MTSHLHFYTDRALVDSLPSDLSDEMKSHYLIRRDDQRVSFSGMIMTGDGISIFLPRNSPIPQANSVTGYRYASLLMKGLKRYTRDKALNKIDSDGDGSIGGAKLAVIVDLLEDYCTYGIYTRRLREKVTNMGKPDWRKTVASQAALIGSSGPIYLNVCGSRYRSFSNCEVAKIHAFVVRELDETYSWIITGSDISISDAAAIIPPPVQDNNLMIRALENELSLVYSDREIRLINLLIDYIRNTRGHNSSSEVIGLSHFHTMWERMINSTLDWVVTINDQLSIPTYRFEDETLYPASMKRQRTDTVMHNKSTNQYVVIDAKYYGAQGLNSAPGWSDIVKQFYYAKAIKILAKGAEVDNAFIFPGSGPLKSVHMQSIKSKKIQDDEYPPIKCFYVPPMELLEYYVSGRIYKDFSNRLMSIEGST